MNRTGELPLAAAGSADAGQRPSVPGLPLGRYLARLIWLCVLPLLLLAVWLAWGQVRDGQRQRDQAAAALARNLATSIDHRLTQYTRALNMLALSPLNDDPARRGDLYREAQGFQQSFDSHVILAAVGAPGEAMPMLFNTRQAFGSALPMLPRPQGKAAAPTAVATGRPAVGDSFVGPVAKELLVAIAVPVMRQGKPVSVLLTTLAAAGFRERLEQVALPAGWSVRLVDGRGDIIARRAPPGMDSGRDVDPNGRFVVSSEVSPWSVVLEVPRAARRGPLLATGLALGLGLLVATLAAVLGGQHAARRLGQAMAVLSGTPAAASEAPVIAEIVATQRRLDAAAAGLQASEARFRQLFGEAPVAMALVDHDGRIVARNSRFTLTFGYPPEELRHVDDWWRLAYPDAAYRSVVVADWQRAVAQAVADGSDIAAGESRIRCRDGAERTVSIAGIVMPEGVLASFLDLTEQRQAEAGLRLWAQAFEQAQLGLAISDARSNTLVAVNPAFAAERGYGREDMAGMPVSRLFPDERVGELMATLARLDPAGHGVVESEHIGKDGRRFPVLLDITVVHDGDGRPLNRIVYALDLTERRRAEQALAAAQAEALERQKRARLAALNQMQDANAARARAEAVGSALRESEERLKLFIEHAPASLAMFDREMRYLSVSRRWREAYGLGDRPLIGESHYAVFPEIGDEWQAVHRRGLAGEVIRADSDRFERADGRIQWLRWEVRPWHASDGRIGGIVVFSEDITRQRLADDEVRRLNVVLERRVVERTAELSAANRELESFAYAVSHDLRAPLRAMNGFSRALVEDFGETLPGDARVYLDQIGIASRRMGELIDGLLALSRSTRGGLQLDNLDLSALARRLLDDLARGEPARRVTLAVEPGLRVRGDARMLEAALGNLLGNAWKYTAGTPAATIRVHAELQDGVRWFCVSDNGAGFDMAHAERLFKPFQRLHRQDEFPGIGIGLATVQRIIHRHGGEIVATAEPSRGACFRFTLPDAATPGENS